MGQRILRKKKEKERIHEEDRGDQKEGSVHV